MPSARYPWFETTSSADIEQGDIFDDCPVFLPPSDLAHEVSDAAVFRWETRDLIVMTQSCDIVRSREKVTEVPLCPVWLRSEIPSGHIAPTHGLQDALPGHL